MYSHKFHSAGLSNEVGVCIFDGHIVWINGPFPYQSNQDITIFCSKMKRSLNWGEHVEADAGYQGEPLFVSVPKDFGTQLEAKQRARTRHEHINR
jgi:hypothetical protein